MPDSPAKSGRRKNGTFTKGVSGNPHGRPAGSRHSVSLAAEALIAGEAEALTRRVIQQAMGGDKRRLSDENVTDGVVNSRHLSDANMRNLLD